jgi:hypothetical protein
MRRNGAEVHNSASELTVGSTALCFNIHSGDGGAAVSDSMVICSDLSFFLLLDFHAKNCVCLSWAGENQAAQAV